MLKTTSRVVLVAVVAGLATPPMSWKGKIALVLILAIFGTYGLLFWRLRNRRVGSAAVGSFYDMLEADKRRAIEMIVDQRCEEQAPEDAQGNGKSSK